MTVSVGFVAIRLLALTISASLLPYLYQGVSSLPRSLAILFLFLLVWHGLIFLSFFCLSGFYSLNLDSALVGCIVACTGPDLSFRLSHRACLLIDHF